MAHARRKAPPATAEKTGDQISRDAFPILFDQCRPSIERLARFDRENWFRRGDDLRRWRPEGRFDRDGLEEHARTLLSHVQHELAARTSPLPFEVAFELSRSRKVALEALLRIGHPDGNRYAKAVAAELAAPGVPLAICIGSGYEKRVYGMRFAATGCRAIFEDAPYGRGNMWASWCPNCRAKNGRRNPARDQARALRRRLEAAN